MKYMEVPGNHRNPALCSDDDCPCGSPGAVIPPGEGYMYVSDAVARFRADCLTEQEARVKVRLMEAQTGAMILGGSGVFVPVLMCEQGARRRGLDLAVAAADAKHWWKTGLVPLRPTPRAGQSRPMPGWMKFLGHPTVVAAGFGALMVFTGFGDVRAALSLGLAIAFAIVTAVVCISFFMSYVIWMQDGYESRVGPVVTVSLGIAVWVVMGVTIAILAPGADA